ncbi:MAG: hypothetical protein PHZ04_00020 [Patescibacteria group bacterium]|nr:hypothetical protein [Patescibacteria group bacterium]MDD5294991.1 hypothetical protein [Patescibacteria group bacterium]MDD5554545.1 hypothetical protein [Patescibacteria group bacterium]
MKEIGVLYVSYDEGWLAAAILGHLRENSDMAIVCVGGDNFPFAKQLLSVSGQPFKVVVLHMLAGCHELGYRQADRNFSTGLLRAEMLRKQGLEIPIVLISTQDLRRGVVHDHDARVKKARVHFVGYDNGFRDIADTVRRVAGG